jgi:hypothetical protein
MDFSQARPMSPTLPTPKFAHGQRVRVILNERNRTPHVGTVSGIEWHYKHQQHYYCLEEAGKKVSKRYGGDDLEEVKL